jgi:Xaa-Pro dipeptidase
MGKTGSVDASFPAHLAAATEAVNAALAALPADVLVIHAGSAKWAFQDDQTYPYRVNPWFSWLAPVRDAPDSLLVWTPGRRPRLVLVLPEDYWHQPPVAPDDPWTGHFDLELKSSAQAALETIAGLAGRVAWIGESSPPRPDWTANPPALLRRLEQARCRKSDYELDCMREATRLGVRGHVAAEKAFRGGASEFEIHLAFLAACSLTDEELPYASIVALNAHGATLHYQLRDRTPPPVARSLLIDAGAACRGYASDITRTHAGADVAEFSALVAGLNSLQLGLCSEVRAGTDWRALHLTAHARVAALLQHIGVVDLAPEDAVTLGVTSCFLPHGLGHLLGLQVHDVGGLHADAESAAIDRPAGHPALRMTRRLVAGMVVTVEPGIYFIDSLLGKLRAGPHSGHVDWALVDRLRPCGGIRVEDNVVVREQGQENLTREAFAATA